MTPLDLAREERAEFADFLAGLSPRELTRRFVKGRLQTGRINALTDTALEDRSSAQLVTILRDNAESHGLGAGFGGRVALTDNMIRQQDIRRPLGLVRTIPSERLCAAMDFVRYNTDHPRCLAGPGGVSPPPTSTGPARRGSPPGSSVRNGPSREAGP